MLSLLRFTHEPPQKSVPVGQLPEHMPPRQTSPGLQAVPQSPQWLGSEPVSVQTPSHTIPPPPAMQPEIADRSGLCESLSSPHPTNRHTKSQVFMALLRGSGREDTELT